MVIVNKSKREELSTPRKDTSKNVINLGGQDERLSFDPAVPNKKLSEKSPAKQVNISFNVDSKKMLKGLLLVSLLVLTFFAGRFTSLGFGNEESVSGLATAEQEVVAEESPAVAENLVAEEETAVSEEVTVVEENKTVEEVVEEKEEELITSYSKVALSLDEIESQLKSAADEKPRWGTITKVKYTIKNNENGKIMPKYLVIMAPANKDYEKDVRVSEEMEELSSTEKASEWGVLESPFSFNEKTVGNLEKVKLIVQLFDYDDKVMASFSGTFDLS